jgi:hypothetical protein
MLGAGLVAAAVAMLGAGTYVALSGGFGAGDLRPFGLWCGLLAGFVGTVSVLLMRLRLPARRSARISIAVIVGLLSGVLFTVAVMLGLGPWIGAFSFPVFQLWALGAVAGLTVLVWPAAMAAPTSGHAVPALLGVGAVLAAVALLPRVLLLGGVYVWDRAEPEVHLLPAGYRGPVVIIFGQADGAALEREGRARVYRIPTDGVLRTQFDPNEGWRAPDYFYVDGAGRRTPIVRGAPCADSLPDDPVQACLLGRMYLGGRTGAEYSAYVVTRLADRSVLTKRADSLIRAVVFGDSVALAP